MDALDPSKTSRGWKTGSSSEEVGSQQFPFPSNLGSRSASRPPEGARSLSELKPRRRLLWARKGCGVEGSATSEKISPWDAVPP